MKKRKLILLIITIVSCTLAGFWIGRTTGIGSDIVKISNNSIKPLRMTGYQYIKPLLACDTVIDMVSPKMNTLSKNIQKYIKSEINAGRIGTVSVYIRDYQNGYVVNVNPNEKYYPASLGKIPMMIAAFKSAAKDSNFLTETHQYNVGNDLNQTSEIMPKDILHPGETYSVSQAIDKMIISSDNNSLFFLNNYINSDLVDKTFKDLKVPLSQNEMTPKDFLTAKEYSYFIRVLYNSTYIEKDYSEKALEILSKSEYKNGLAAGLPKNTTIAHKFGIRTYEENGQTMRELHDCGIVYTDTPYLICVMTKNNSTLSDSESVIRDISSMTYDSLRK